MLIGRWVDGAFDGPSNVYRYNAVSGSELRGLWEGRPGARALARSRLAAAVDAHDGLFARRDLPADVRTSVRCSRRTQLNVCLLLFVVAAAPVAAAAQVVVAYYNGLRVPQEIVRRTRARCSVCSVLFCSVL